MDESPDNKDHADGDDDSMIGNIVGCVIGLLVLGLSMYWTWNFVGPCGQTMNIKSFLLFWLREVIFLGMLAIGLFAWGFIWLVNVFREKFAGKRTS